LLALKRFHSLRRKEKKTTLLSPSGYPGASTKAAKLGNSRLNGRLNIKSRNTLSNEFDFKNFAFFEFLPGIRVVGS